MRKEREFYKPPLAGIVSYTTICCRKHVHSMLTSQVYRSLILNFVFGLEIFSDLFA